jgi:phosphatidylinositol glycan class A protein
VNLLLKYTLRHVGHVICVSHTQKENLFLRGDLDVDKMSVIPNSVDCNVFTPRPTSLSKEKSMLIDPAIDLPWLQSTL